LESGRGQVKIPVNMVDEFRKAMFLFETLAHAKDISMNIKVPDKTTLVTLDRELTKQCIINPVDDAISSIAPPGSGVTVALTETAGSLKIDVIDNGYGIEEGELEKKFDKFYRGKAAHEEGLGGSGLGLAFVKEAVEAQGETIVAESTPEQRINIFGCLPNLLNTCPLIPKATSPSFRSGQAISSKVFLLSEPKYLGIPFRKRYNFYYG